MVDNPKSKALRLTSLGGLALGGPSNIPIVRDPGSPSENGSGT